MTEIMDVASDMVNKSVPMDLGPGLSLRQAREARNLSVADVKSALRFREGIVEALECDDYNGLPAPIFVKGYLRSYARLVGVGEGPVLAQYQAQGPSEPPPLAPTFPATSAFHSHVPWPIVLGALGVLVIITALFMLKSEKQDQVASEQVIVQEAIAEIDSNHNDLTQDMAGPDLETAVESDTGELLAEAEMGLHYAVLDVTEIEPSVSSVPTEQILRLTISDDCWAEITDNDGRRLIYELLKSGTVKKVEGVAPFSVVLGNADAVQLEYKGEVYDFSSSIRRNIARFLVGSDGSFGGG